MKFLRKARQIAGFVVLLAFVLVFVRFDSFAWLAKPLTAFQSAPLTVQIFLTTSITGLIIIVLIALTTAFLGRVYCSVLCPLGLLQDVILRLRGLLKRFRFAQLPPLLEMHYGLAAIAFASAASGFMLPLSTIEPFAATGRLLTAVFQPVAAAIFRFSASLSGNTINWFGQASIKPVDGANTAAVCVFAVIMLFLCFKWGRVYCNSICPVGAALRFIARFSLFRISIDANRCTSCGMCESICKAGCIDVLTKNIDFSRCVSCYNCIDTCKFAAVGLHRAKTVPEIQELANDNFSAGRRAVTGSLLAAAAGYWLPAAVFAKSAPTNAILPPGAQNYQQFSSRCISCHLCVVACPSSVIKPAAALPGVKSLQQPSLDFTLGMCEQNCIQCSQICPVMAITPITAEHKKFLKIGEVVYKKHLCVVEVNGTDCGACAEHCPTQAVRMVPYQGNLMIPETIPEICIGCGSCEHICPVRPEKAIIVKSIAQQVIIKMPEQEKLPEKPSNAEFPF